MRSLRIAAAIGAVCIVAAGSPAAAETTPPPTGVPGATSTSPTASTALPPTTLPAGAVPDTAVPEAAATTAAPSVPTTSSPAARHARAVTTNPVISMVSNASCSFCFTPDAVTIAAGGTVTWKNTDDVQHTVARCTSAVCNGTSGGTGTDTNFGSAVLALPPGASFRYTFTDPGTYVYYCTLHGYALMRGTITVTAAAPSTTVAAPTTVAATPATPPAPDPPVAAGPALADTGGRTNGMFAVAMIMIGLGLAASSFGLRRRYPPFGGSGELPSQT